MIDIKKAIYNFSFSFFLFFTCFVLQTGLGYKLGVYVFIGFSCFYIFLKFRNRVGIFDSFIFVISFLIFFDAPAFVFTSLNFRLWYLLVLPLFIYYFFKNDLYFFKKRNPFYLIAISVLLVLSFVCFIFDPMNGKVYMVKYFFFTFATMELLYCSYIRISEKMEIDFIIHFFLNIFVFLCFYGILQYICILFIKPFASRYISDVGLYRPCAFFSETTWYGELLVFALVLSVYEFFHTNRFFYFLISLSFLFGIFLSATRNAIFGVLLVAFISVLFIFMSGKITLKKRNTKALIFSIFLIFSFIYFSISGTKFIEALFSMFSFIVEKFTHGDISSRGRLMMLNESVYRFLQNPLWGYGFSFDSINDVLPSGTFLGAKNANVLLMVLHIFGLAGFIPFCFLFLLFFLKSGINISTKNNSYSKISFIFLIFFFAVGMTAPIHQFSLGNWVVSFALFLDNIANNNKKYL